MASLTDADFAPPAVLSLPETAVEKTDEDGLKEPTVDENGIPLLKSFLAEDNDTRAEGLHIVADSVAQQRNLVSGALIYHPFAIAFLIASFAFLRQVYYKGETSDYIMIITLFTGVTMAVLGAIRLVCGPYIFEAEKVGTWNWLDQGRSTEEEETTGLKVLGEADTMLVTKFGDDYIGAIIFRGVQPTSPAPSPAGNKKARRAQSPPTHTKMLIRGWSVGQKYRRKEVGSALLEDAIRIGKEKGWTADGVEFAADHANHKRVVPTMFNGALIKYERVAQRTLDKKLQELEGSQEKGRKRK